MKLEAGKTYVFKDDAARDEFISNDTCNRGIVKDYYKDGFLIESVTSEFEAVICADNFAGIDKSEFHLFKEKESKPFDISEYRFSDKDVKECMDTYINAEFKLSINLCSRVLELNKQDAEAIAKHFKLI